MRGNQMTTATRTAQELRVWLHAHNRTMLYPIPPGGVTTVIGLDKVEITEFPDRARYRLVVQPLQFPSDLNEAALRCLLSSGLLCACNQTLVLSEDTKTVMDNGDIHGFMNCDY